MTTESTMQHDLRVTRERLAGAEKLAADLREERDAFRKSIETVQTELDKAQVSKVVQQPNGLPPRIMTTAERVAFMHHFNSHAARELANLRARLQSIGSTAGGLVGPDGKPILRG